MKLSNCSNTDINCPKADTWWFISVRKPQERILAYFLPVKRGIIQFKDKEDLSMIHLRMRITRIAILGILLTIPFLGAQEKSFTIEEWEKGLNRRQPPVKIMDAIRLKPGMVIGEVGAGTGRMTMWLASRVGDAGMVYANDINERSLEQLRERSKRDGFKNVEIIIGEVENPKLPRNTLDIAFMINVYHHLDAPVPLIRNILPSLKPDGILGGTKCFLG